LSKPLDIFNDESMERFLRWFYELPEDIRNYVGEYEELKVAE